MVHAIREEHLDDICANCKQHPGYNKVLQRNNHKVYEITTCEHCGYEIIKFLPDQEFTDKWEMIHRN